MTPAFTAVDVISTLLVGIAIGIFAMRAAVDLKLSAWRKALEESEREQ